MLDFTVANDELVRRVIDIWNHGDLDAADAVFGAEYLNHGGLIVDLVRGPEAIKMSVTLYRVAFPDFYIAVEGPATEQAAGVTRWTAYSRRPPVVEGIVDRPCSLRGITRWRFERGKIAESWTVWNRKALLKELTVIEFVR